MARRGDVRRGKCGICRDRTAREVIAMQENVAWKELLFVTRRERRDGVWGRGAPDAILLILLLVMLCCGALMS